MSSSAFYEILSEFCRLRQRCSQKMALFRMDKLALFWQLYILVGKISTVEVALTTMLLNLFIRRMFCAVA